MIRISTLLLVCVVFLVACGSKKAQAPAPATTSSPSTTAAAPTTTATTATTTGGTSGPGALQAEVAATGAGDIPDNQVFVVYSGKSFSMKFPEGWTQSGSGDNVTFRDKNNIVRIVIVPGSAPTVASVQKEVASLKGVTPTGTPTTMTIGGLPAVKVTYKTTSAPNPVTGKRLTLTVDRYELTKNGKRVIVDLGSPVGVDNVDAYRMMIQSLRLK
jgi:hypothetical protein